MAKVMQTATGLKSNALNVRMFRDRTFIFLKGIRMNVENLLTFLVENGIRWVESQITENRSTARDLTLAEKEEFALFFESNILDTARIKMVPVIDNPDFYSTLQEMNIPKLLDLRMVLGITFKDTIILSQRLLGPDSAPKELLFHELVHVVQYEVLGLRRFVEHYVQGWVKGGLDYYAIPLEIDAYDLEERYKKDPKAEFSVRQAVLKRLGGRS
jgi:hypothetical protein